MRKTKSSTLMLAIAVCMILVVGCSLDESVIDSKSDFASANEIQEVVNQKEVIQQRIKDDSKLPGEIKSRENPSMQKGERGEMQEQLVDACSNKEEGSFCSFQSRRGETEGVCEFSEDKLLCRRNKEDGLRR